MKKFELCFTFPDSDTHYLVHAPGQFPPLRVSVMVDIPQLSPAHAGGIPSLTCGEHLIPLLDQELAEAVRREGFACRRDKRPKLIGL